MTSISNDVCLEKFGCLRYSLRFPDSAASTLGDAQGTSPLASEASAQEPVAQEGDHARCFTPSFPMRGMVSPQELTALAPHDRAGSTFRYDGRSWGNPEIQTLHDFLGQHPMYHRHLAELMGVKTGTVDKWSNGDRRITQRTLNRPLAKVTQEDLILGRKSS